MSNCDRDENDSSDDIKRKSENVTKNFYLHVPSK